MKCLELLEEVRRVLTAALQHVMPLPAQVLRQVRLQGFQVQDSLAFLFFGRCLALFRNILSLRKFSQTLSGSFFKRCSES